MTQPTEAPRAPSGAVNGPEALRKLDPAELKVIAIRQYGGKCHFCGESNPEFLGIAHNQTRLGGIHKYRFLASQQWPSGGLVVCNSCVGSRVHQLLPQEPTRSNDP